MCLCVLSRAQLFVTPRSVACQASLFMEFSRQEQPLELVAISYSRRSSWPRDGTRVSCISCIGGGFFTTSATWQLLFNSVQSLTHVQLFATPWTAAHQASLSITNSRSLLKFMSIESMMPSSHLILCHPLLLSPSIFPSSGCFQMSQFFTSGGQSIGVSVSASVFPMNIQD